MALVHTSNAVGTAVVTIVPAGGENYQFVAIANGGPSATYLKMVASTVTLTVSNGIPLQPGAAMIIDQDVTPILTSGVSAICASGATTTVVVQAY
jgi:hypothetical protein